MINIYIPLHLVI